MTEAIITNYDISGYEFQEQESREQLMLLEKQATYGV
ncbi:MAG: hypothetical protein [Olavius algarvensis Gamma 1 endosymbiont]|nr:MAG: hypothetical protein [Olavius algarvensis Gamma 1 endosymbiont]